MIDDISKKDEDIGPDAYVWEEVDGEGQYWIEEEEEVEDKDEIGSVVSILISEGFVKGKGEDRDGEAMDDPKT